MDPKTLHKYLYAGGDPINAMDPSGRAELFETGAILDASSLATTKAVAAYASAVFGAYCKIAGILAWVGSHHWLGINPFDLPEPFAAFCAFK